MAVSPRCLELLREVSAEILEAQRPIRVLRAISWDESVERAFFASGARELPRPEYRVMVPDVATSLERFRALKARVMGENAIERFLRETCESFATAGGPTSRTGASATPRSRTT